MTPAAWEHAAAGCDDSGHRAILDVAEEGGNHPPMYDISTFGRADVSAVRSSE